MKHLTIRNVLPLAALLFCVVSNAQTPAESNEVVKALLEVTHIHYDNFTNWPPMPPRIQNFRTPSEFFSLPVGGDGWDPDSRKAAFDTYLDNWASYNFSVETNVYFSTTELAVSQIAFMHYTNAVPALKNLILNPTCTPRVRSRAVETVVPLMAMDLPGNGFIESVFTNKVAYTTEVRGLSCGMYIERLLDGVTNGLCSTVVVSNAVERFYRHRKVDATGGRLFDEFFRLRIEGYATSSNRLDFAVFTLDRPECSEWFREEFTAITNQLLSSGQTLRQLNIGETGE